MNAARAEHLACLWAPFWLCVSLLLALRPRGRKRAPATGAVRFPIVLRSALRGISTSRFLARLWWHPGLAAKLGQTGLQWVAEEYVGLRGLVLGVGGFAGASLLLGRGGDALGVFLAICLGILGWFAPEAWLNRAIARNREQVERALPDFLDRLVMSLEGGKTFEMAAYEAQRGLPGRLGEEIGRLSRQVRRGRVREEALQELAHRNPTPVVRAMTMAIGQSLRLGSPLGTRLRAQARLVRAGQRRKAQELARRLPIVIVFPLVFCFLPALMIVYLGPPLLHLILGV